MEDPDTYLYIIAESDDALLFVIDDESNSQIRDSTIFNGHIVPCLALRFSNSHANSGVMGGSAEDCDIVFPHIGGVSQQHFTITFDEHYRLCLIDHSSFGTRVGYFGQQGEKRRNYTWLLIPPHTRAGDFHTLEVSHWLKFFLVVGNLEKTASPDYERRVGKFFANADRRSNELGEGDGIMPPGAGAGTIEPTVVGTPLGDSHVYVTRELGSGGFGTVKSVWDATTGEIYALKTPNPSWFLEDPRRSWENWEREAAIMSSVSHKHIVKFLGTATHNDPGYERRYFSPNASTIHPGILLEYIEGGSLFQCKEQLQMWEIAEMLCQLLSALQYLHGHDPPVCHRDIKPGNILIQERSSRKIRVKFADFGLAKTGLQLLSTVGTEKYAAPEIFELSNSSTGSTLYSSTDSYMNQCMHPSTDSLKNPLLNPLTDIPEDSYRESYVSMPSTGPSAGPSMAQPAASPVDLPPSTGSITDSSTNSSPNPHKDGFETPVKSGQSSVMTDGCEDVASGEYAGSVSSAINRLSINAYSGPSMTYGMPLIEASNTMSSMGSYGDSSMAVPIDPREAYSSLVDIYSLGVVIAERVCGTPDWTSSNKSHWSVILHNHVRQQMKQLKDHSKSKSRHQMLYFVLRNMMVRDPNSRLSAAQCLMKASNFKRTPPSTSHHAH